MNIQKFITYALIGARTNYQNMKAYVEECPSAKEKEDEAYKDLKFIEKIFTEFAEK